MYTASDYNVSGDHRSGESAHEEGFALHIVYSQRSRERVQQNVCGLCRITAMGKAHMSAATVHGLCSLQVWGERT